MSLEKQSWIHLASVQIGGAICLPILLIGFELASLSGEAFLAIMTGNCILFSLAAIASRMSVANKASTAQNAEVYFGQNGRACFAAILSFSMCAWFAIQAEVMAEDLYTDSKLLAGGITVLIVLATLTGIRGISRLANVSVPLMALTLIVSLYFASKEAIRIETTNKEMSLFQGISLVLGAGILAVVDLPTFFRHARSQRDGQIACGMIFLVGLPLVELAGCLLGKWTHATSLMEALTANSHPLWKGWIVLFILLAGWTTNNANLYSGAISLQAVFQKLSQIKSILLIGAISLILSLCGIISRLTLVLDLMGIVVASMGAVVLTAYLMRNMRMSHNSFAWVLGVASGLMHLAFNVTITPVAIIDSGLVATLTLLLMKTWIPSYEKA